MKRKALLVSMAMLTGMPGWALAKGTGTVDGAIARSSHAYPDDSPFDDELRAVADLPPRQNELLAQLKAMLLPHEGDEVAGMPARQRPAGWKLMLLGTADSQRDSGAPLSLTGGDPRGHATKQLGVAFRLKF